MELFTEIHNKPAEIYVKKNYFLDLTQLLEVLSEPFFTN